MRQIVRVSDISYVRPGDFVIVVSLEDDSFIVSIELVTNIVSLVLSNEYFDINDLEMEMIVYNASVAFTSVIHEDASFSSSILTLRHSDMLNRYIFLSRNISDILEFLGVDTVFRFVESLKRMQNIRIKGEPLE